MLDDERVTQPLPGAQLVSYALGELDAEAQIAIEKRLEADPSMAGELDDIRSHIGLHQRVRKVAPRRGSFERLLYRMKKSGVTDGAIPGTHCMLRRAFLAAIVFGIAAVTLLTIFGGRDAAPASLNVIGQIVYTSPVSLTGQRRDEVERAELVVGREYSTGAYDAFVWLPTGVTNTYSSLEVTQNTEFQFLDPRQIHVNRGFLRRIEVQPGGLGEGNFVVHTPHGRVQVDDGSLSINITRDGAETQVTVLSGSARVYGVDSDRAFVVNAGHCTIVERGRLPNPPRPVLKLMLNPLPTSELAIEALLINDSYVPVKIRRAVETDRVFREPVFMLYASHASEFTPGTTPENVTLPPWPVTPEPDPASDHTGEMWLEPGQSYRFTFDISTLLVTTPRVEHWLRLEYRGDLYGPPGHARVRIQSENLKLDRRTR